MDRINAFIENNKRLEKCLFSAGHDNRHQHQKQQQQPRSAASNRKSMDLQSPSGSLNHSHCSSQFGKMKSDRSYVIRKPSYAPAQVVFGIM